MDTSVIAGLHHVGFVVASIQTAAEGFTALLSAQWDGTIVHDPLQRAKVAFLRTPGAADALIELVEPAGEDSPVRRFLENRKDSQRERLVTTGKTRRFAAFSKTVVDCTTCVMRLRIWRRPLPRCGWSVPLL